ncbi:MAG: serine hydrolase domain-containing protein [Paracoccaceae bacterium]
MRPTLTRRRTLGLMAALPFAGRASADPFEPVLARAAALDQLHSLIVTHAGETVLSRAVRGPALDRPVNVKSVSKTVVALLTGIAIRKGAIPGPDATLGAVAPRLIPPGADPRVAALTLADLLTMRAGLARTSGANYGRWVESPDWIAHALTRPFRAEPGSRFQYSTGSFHVLGAALAEATGESLLTLAREWLGRPLGIDIPPWTRDPQGYYLGGNNMALSPLALARLGECVRRGGRWQGAEVIPADWIAASWQPRTRSPFSGDAYGYGWFLTQLGGEEMAYARGYGGQMLYVSPGKALTVAITSDPTRPARTHGHVGALNRLVADAILPRLV